MDNKDQLPSYEEVMKNADSQQNLPSYDDLMKNATKAEPVPSTAESALAGTEQGMTAGQAPWMSTALPLLAEVSSGEPNIASNKKLKEQGFKGDVGPTSLLEMYHQLRDNYKKQNEKAAAANPVANFAGNLAGGGLLMSGLGMAVPSITSKIANPMGLGAEAGVMAKAANAGIQGAGMNTIYGAGSGDTDYIGNSPENIGKDVVGNATVGGLVGGGLSLAGQGVMGTLKAASDLPVVQNVATAAKGAFQGKSYTGQEGAYKQQQNQLGGKILNTLRDNAYQQFANKRAAVATATAESGPIDISDSLHGIIEDAQNMPELTEDQVKTKKNMLNIFGKMLNGTETAGPQTQLTPTELVTKMQELQQAYPEGPDTAQARQFLTRATDKLETPLRQAVPNLDELNTNSKNAMELFERLTGKSIFSASSKDNVANAQMTDKLAPLLEKADRAPQKLNDILNGFGGVPAGQDTAAVQGTPGLKANAPNATDYIQNKATELAKDLKAARSASISNEHSEGFWKTLFGGLGGAATKVGEVAGGMAREVTPPPLRSNPAVNNVGRLMDLDTPALTETAHQIAASGHPQAQQYSSTLLKAANSTGIGKTAAMYSLMQQPEFRQLIHSDDMKTPEVEDESAPKGP